MEAGVGIEPASTALQFPALPQSVVLRRMAPQWYVTAKYGAIRPVLALVCECAV